MAITVPYNFRFKEVEIDLGNLPVESADFIINDSALTATSSIAAWLSGKAPTGKDIDELEMDAISLSSSCYLGYFKLHIRGLEGYLEGKFKINYIKG